MKQIVKKTEPRSLTRHRRAPHSDYPNYAHKDQLRISIVTEQRGLCCYCMGRISPSRDAMKIEHWHCQARYAGEQLDYKNLLGSCCGGERQPRFLQHCDTRKGDEDMMWNPADAAHGIEHRIRYGMDGTIRSDDAQFDSDLSDVLNLNIQFLKNNRVAVLKAVLDWWKDEKGRRHGPVPKAILQKKRASFSPATGELSPYCQVAVWFLDQRLSKMKP